MIKKVKLFLICFLPTLTMAAHTQNKNMGIGDRASTLFGPVSILNNFIGSASIVIGISCLFGCFFRYMQYRINPLAAPLSSVLMLLVLGLVLLGLPFIYMLVAGIPFTLYTR